MTARLIEALLRLAPRERLLLGVLLVVIMPLGIVFGVLLPLSDQRKAAMTELQEVRALSAWVAARQAEVQALAPPDDPAGIALGPRPAIGLSALEKSLVSAFLRDPVTSLANRSDGGIELRFDAVPFQDFMAWLSSQDPDWGYDIVGLRIGKSDDPGIVSVDMRLKPQG